MTDDLEQQSDEEPIEEPADTGEELDPEGGVMEGDPWDVMAFQRHWLNPLLSAVCRVTGWNFYWNWNGRRHLVILSDRTARKWVI